ncbi:MAG TPA: phage holin family protein [Solirubrobacteraceae bacterium]|nr:phage holin family protein [Solirubrobacteraceae bacterium]
MSAAGGHGAGAQPVEASEQREAPEPRTRHTRRLAPGRIAVVWILSAITVWVVGELMPGVTLKSFGSAVWLIALIGLLNGLVWPLLLRVALPLTVLTLGFGVLLVNGAVVFLLSELNLGLHVSSFAGALVITIAISLVDTAAMGVLAIDDDGPWYRNVVARNARRTSPGSELDKPGLLLLEIDGLAHDVLVRALRDGNAPTMARWLREGSHHLTRWETDWSSQTGACQAGLLHGNNEDMPAFRWWEKESGKAIVTNHPRDAAELERRHSDGRGLLFADGASRANILSGDAPHSLLTMSTVLQRERHGRMGQDYFAYFANPYNVTRTFVLVIREIFSERWHASRQRRRDIQPRIPRSRMYAVVRAWATVIQRDLQVASVISDMYGGRPVIYTTFLAYDEVAHHSGIERPDALATLAALDRQIGRLERVAEDAPRRYELVVLADHGQSQGATFLDRYGITLEALVEEQVKAGTSTVDGNPSEALGYMGASLSEAASGSGAPARIVRRLTSSRSSDGDVRLGGGDAAGSDVPAADGASGSGAAQEPPEVVVMASGCLGLISFPREPGRLSLERIGELYPGLLPALCGHPGIGFALVRSDEHGGVVLGAEGTHFLDQQRVEGSDPLQPYGPNAPRHVRRTDGFPHCPDIVLNSTYWREWDEVAAFEELVGSHGGLGGSQSHPFLLHPVTLPLPEAELVGAEAVHRELRRWLVHLGHGEYGGARRESEPAAATSAGASADT